jgi:glycosyltransferase involved in cell wall biosynthesis
MAAVGVYRVIGFCKYLPQYGWNPIVLTVKKGATSLWDPSLSEKVYHVKVYRSINPSLSGKSRPKNRTIFKDERKADNSRTYELQFKDLPFFRKVKRFTRLLLTVPDGEIFWIPFAVIKGLQIIRMENISIIMSSSPPVSVHLIASFLGRLTGIPYVTDFRDLWTLNHIYGERKHPSSIIKYDKFWERFALRKAKMIITASRGFTTQMECYLANKFSGKIETITNGFDYDEIDLKMQVRKDNKGVLKFLYAGSLYSYFNPVYFLDCFSAWLKNYAIDKKRVRIDFYSRSDTDYSNHISSLGLEDIVCFHRFKSQIQLFELLATADYLLLFLGFNKSCANVIPAKLFEYLASGTKILALTPPGITADLIKEYDGGYCLFEADSDKMIKILVDIFYKWNNEKVTFKKIRYISKIDRKEKAKELASLLDNLTCE